MFFSKIWKRFFKDATCSWTLFAVATACRAFVCVCVSVCVCVACIDKVWACMASCAQCLFTFLSFPTPQKEKGLSWSFFFSFVSSSSFFLLLLFSLGLLHITFGRTERWWLESLDCCLDRLESLQSYAPPAVHQLLSQTLHTCHPKILLSHTCWSVKSHAHAYTHARTHAKGTIVRVRQICP